MLRIVFPTNQKMSYLSKVESNFKESNYFTVLNVTGQNITAVETYTNKHLDSYNEIIDECKANNFGILILPECKDFPVKELKNNGISVFTYKSNKTVLNTFSDFIQDKLIKID